MNVQITHVIVHTPEQTREILHEAQAIANEITDLPEQQLEVFRQACRLLGQRFTMAASSEPVPIDLSKLRPNSFPQQ